ncbi:MAG: aminopeptidase P family protein [Thermomicrobiales bacterium]|nr:aminopeptidase P family protein [Thermomicrobiales bacterium]
MTNTSESNALPLTEAQIARRELVAEKHAQARSLLQKHGIDVWLTFSREGSDLLLPYAMGGEYLVGQAALMVFAEGPSVAIVADYDTGQVEGAFDVIHGYHDDWLPVFLDTLRERNPARIAINYSESDSGTDGLTYGLYLRLTKALDQIGMADRIESSEPITSMLRAVKTPLEIERIRRACAITQMIFDDVTAWVRPGLTEMQVHEFINERMQAYEVTPSWDASYCPSVTTSRHKPGHEPPSDDPIRPGDGLQIDFGVFFEGYASDLQRMWYFRKPGETEVAPDQQHAFDTMVEAIRMAAQLIEPGKRGYEIDEAVRNYVKERGYTFTHALGHQVGRLCHDGGLLLGPRNARYGDRVTGEIVPGMVFTLEPCIHDLGVEENIVVTEEGVEWLTPPQSAVYII